ncbi:hypothetical protein ACF060_32350 [Streptomyces werraensis]|uniref:hypothetical protein n=1 Tax=Streptomyces werraensis TaxID=68284 RepID=UPI0036F8E568
MLMSPGEPPLVDLARAAVMSVGAVAVPLVLRAREKRAARSSADRLVILEAAAPGRPPSSPADRETMRDLVEQRLHRPRRRKPALVMLCLMYTLLVTVLLLLDSGREVPVHGVLTLPLLTWQGGRPQMGPFRPGQLGGLPRRPGSHRTVRRCLDWRLP